MKNLRSDILFMFKEADKVEAVVVLDSCNYRSKEVQLPDAHFLGKRATFY